MALNPTLRINLAKVVFSSGPQARPILDHCRAEGLMCSRLADQLRGAVKELRKGRMGLEEGPYADDQDAVVSFCDWAAMRTVSRIGLIERLIELANDPSAFAYDESIVLDGPVTAGTILTDRSRRGAGDVTLFTHVMEPFMLAVSVLRRKGIECYPALAIAGDEEFEPVIAALELSQDVPLATISLSRNHPPLHSLDILSDSAVMGIVCAISAENAARKLARSTLSGMMLRGDMPSEGEVDDAVRHMAEELFASHGAWPYNIFIEKALGFLERSMSNAYGLLSTAFLRARRCYMGEHEFKRQIDLLSAESLLLAEGLAKRADAYLKHMIRNGSADN